MNSAESIDQFRQAFEILHADVQGFREFRLIDPASRSAVGVPTRQRGPVIKYFHVDIKPEVVYDWIRGFMGQYNCYVGRAIRVYGECGRAGASEDVSACSSVSFDIDAGSKPASNADLETVLDQARKIKAKLACGTLVMTGNGYQVWATLDKPVDIRGRRTWWSDACKEFEDDIVTKSCDWTGDGYKVDPQYDIPRIVRLPGTPNVRSGTWARILGESLELRGHLQSELILIRGGHADERPVAGGLGGVFSAPPERFWALLAKDQKLMESWSGRRQDIQDTSGSGQDMALASRLRALRFDPSEALAILKAKPNKGRSTDAYLELTTRKAYGL